MKPIKDAIKQLECMATNLMGEVQNGNGLATLNYVALDVAIQALQEKLERDKGCEYCEGLTTGEDFIKCPSLNFKMDVDCCTMCGRKLVE